MTSPVDRLQILACFDINCVDTRAVPNIGFVFASVLNNDTNSLFVFERIVHPKTNTNSMTLTRPRRDERTAVGSCSWYPTPSTTTVILHRRRIAI